MFIFDETIISSVFIYLLSCYILFTVKHPRMFHDNGDFKTFGLNENQTMYPFWLITTIIGIVTYYLLLINKGNYV